VEREPWKDKEKCSQVRVRQLPEKIQNPNEVKPTSKGTQQYGTYELTQSLSVERSAIGGTRGRPKQNIFKRFDAPEEK
jgi:hypothetical protein